MKKTGILFCCLLLIILSCSQEDKDKSIKEMLASKAKKEVAFAGVNYTVKNGVVTLSGNAPTDKDKQKVEDKVKKMSGVKEVVNQVVVAPVVLDGDHSLKQSVDSVLKKYPAVMASVQDSVIILEGTTDSKNAQKLISVVQRLQAKGLTNQLVINKQ